MGYRHDDSTIEKQICYCKGWLGDSEGNDEARAKDLVKG